MKYIIGIIIIIILNGCSNKYKFELNRYNYNKEKIDYTNKNGNR